MTIVANVGAVRFEQNYYESMDARCQSCDWAQPWDGRSIVEHAILHGERPDCVECAMATLNLGLRARCTAHGGPERCPRCQASVRCYDWCESPMLTWR